jgi:Transglycosylase SLT domain
MRNKIKSRIPSKIKKAGKASTPNKPAVSVHPWRVCPYGEHWVRTHPMHVPPSKTHPGGSVTTRHQHCAHNPSRKDQLYPEEIQEITNQNFHDLKNKPCPLPLKFRAKGSKYDEPIAGWVQYWNEVLKPDEPLDPNLVKALIASESGFEPKKLYKKTDSNSARGLTQITNATRKLLGGAKGGLKDHLITVTKSELNDPNVNICAGVRWLFEKRRLASSMLKRPASWLEAIWEYKGLRTASKEDAEKIKNIFNKFYEELKKCGKS